MVETEKDREFTVVDFGKVALKCWEVERRVKEGTLAPDTVVTILQLLIEGVFKRAMKESFTSCEIGIEIDPARLMGKRGVGVIAGSLYYDTAGHLRNFDNRLLVCQEVRKIPCTEYCT